MDTGCMLVRPFNDSLDNIEGLASVLTGDKGRPACADGVEKRFQFQCQGVAILFDRGVFEQDPLSLCSELNLSEFTADGALVLGNGVAVDKTEQLCPTFGEIQMDVGVVLKDPHLTDALSGDAAGGDIGDTPVFKAESGVGDIFVPGNHAGTDGIDPLEGTPDETQNDINIVNHEIVNNTDVGTSGIEGSEPLGFNEQRLDVQIAHGPHGPVEPFDVPDLQDTILLFCLLNEGVGLLDCAADGFFNENMDPPLQSRQCHFVMGDGGHNDIQRIDLIQEFLVTRKWYRAQRTAPLLGQCSIDIISADELGLLEL